MHLDRYAIIKEPCSKMVVNASRLHFDRIYRDDGHPRWLIHLKAIYSPNLITIRKMVKKKCFLTYNNISPLLITGAIWEEQVKNPENLPMKGELVGATFGYVDGIMRCTGINLIDRSPTVYYNPAADILTDLKNIV